MGTHPNIRQLNVYDADNFRIILPDSYIINIAGRYSCDCRETIFLDVKVHIGSRFTMKHDHSSVYCLPP